MAYAKIQNGTILIVYPYTWTDFESDNNGTVYPASTNIYLVFPLTDAAKGGFTLVQPVATTPPVYVAAYQYPPLETTPIFIDGVLTQQWAAPVSFVPQSVSGIQLRSAVMASTEAAAIASFVSAQSAVIQMDYNTTDVFNRGDVLLAAIVTAGVLTSAQVDALFVAAAATVV
jgi:hypothetical protein